MVEVLTEKISEIDETVPELPPKDLVCLLLLLPPFSEVKNRFSESIEMFDSVPTQPRIRFV